MKTERRKPENMEGRRKEERKKNESNIEENYR